MASINGTIEATVYAETTRFDKAFEIARRYEQEMAALVDRMNAELSELTISVEMKSE